MLRLMWASTHGEAYPPVNVGLSQHGDVTKRGAFLRSTISVPIMDLLLIHGGTRYPPVLCTEFLPNPTWGLGGRPYHSSVSRGNLVMGGLMPPELQNSPY